MKSTKFKMKKLLILKSFMVKKLSLGNSKNIYLKVKEILISVNKNLALLILSQYITLLIKWNE